MSSNLGNELPEKTLALLSFLNKSRKNSAIFLLTTDRESYPHVALLSPYQVVAVNSRKLLVAVHSSSRSCNLLKSGRKGTLIVQLPPAVQYIRCDFSESGEEDYSAGKLGENLFLATVLETLEDYSEKAPFISELAFDETNTHDPYSEGFERLSNISRRLQK